MNNLLKNVFGSLFFFGVVLLGHFSLSASEKKHPLRLIHADRLSRETIDNRVRQTLHGKVKFQQEKTTIRCDVVTQFVGEDPITLIGHVQINEPTRSLSADTVYFYEKIRKQVAVGNVVSITNSDTTTAYRITY
ncbi:MAG: OstA-like protein, partial [bacterium]